MSNLSNILIKRLNSTAKDKLIVGVQSKLNSYTNGDAKKYVQQLLTLLKEVDNSVKETRVILSQKNSSEFFLNYISLFLAGYTPVIINPGLSDSEVEDIKSETNAVGIISDKRRSIEGLKFQFSTDELQGSISSRDLSDLVEIEKEEAYIIYSSGSTSKPKGIIISSTNMTFEMEAISKGYDFYEGMNHYVVMPMYHASALHRGLSAPFVSGGVIHVDTEFKIDQFWNNIEEYRINFIQVVPTILTLLLENDTDPSSTVRSNLKYIGSASAPHPATLVEKFESRFKIPLAVGYGLSETTCGMFLNKSLNGKYGSVGKPLPGVEFYVVDEKGERLPVGETGEVIIKSPATCVGFVGSDLEVSKRINGEEISTQDYGYVDSDGCLFLKYRKSEMIIRAGYNINPTEIENEICSIPNVSLAVVFGVPNAILGEDIIAYVSIKDGESFNERELRSILKDKLRKYQLPSRLLLLNTDEFKGKTKISRTVLQKKYFETTAKRSDAEFTSVDLTVKKNRRAFLANDSVYIRPLHKKDITSKIYLDNIMDQEVQFYTLSGRYPQSEMSIEDYWSNVKPPHHLVFAICDSETSDYVGNISLRVDYEFQTAEFGRMLFKEYQDRNYSVEAMKLIMEYAFEQLNMEKLWGAGGNPRSLPSLYKLGFQYEGCQRSHYVFKGKRRDLFYVGMLRDEYFEVKNNGFKAKHTFNGVLESSVEQGIRSSASIAFDIDEEKLDMSWSSADISEWDSLSYIVLWSLLEDTFSVSLASSDFMEVVTLGDIGLMIQNKIG